MTRANLIIALFAGSVTLAAAHLTLKTALNLSATMAQAEQMRGM